MKQRYFALTFSLIRIRNIKFRKSQRYSTYEFIWHSDSDIIRERIRMRTDKQAFSFAEKFGNQQPITILKWKIIKGERCVIEFYAKDLTKCLPPKLETCAIKTVKRI